MTILSEIGIVIFFAALAGIIATRFRQPPVLGLLAVGAIIGPHALGLVSQSETVNAFADIGAVLLLFTIGVEFSIFKLVELGLRSFLVAAVKLAIVFFLSFTLAFLAGLDVTTSTYVGIILAITSTALMIKTLEQKGLLYRLEVPLLTGTLIVEDLIAVLALTILPSIRAGKLEALSAVLSISQSLVVLGIAYLGLLFVLHKIFDSLVKFQAKETMILLALSIGLGFSYVAQFLGLTPSIGAFLAGSLIASMPKGKIMEEAVSPFSLAFSSVFFISIGLLVDLNVIVQNIWLVLLLSVANIVFKFIGTGISTYLFGFSSQQAAFSGLAMLSVGEFSLLIAKESTVAVPTLNLVGITAVVVFVSALATSNLVTRYHELHILIRNLIPGIVRTAGRDSSLMVQRTKRAISEKRLGNDVLRALGILVLVGAVAAIIVLLIAAQFAGQNVFSISGINVTIDVLAVIAFGLLLLLLSKALARLLSSTLKQDASHSGIKRFERVVKILALLILAPVVLSILNVTLSVKQLAAGAFTVLLVWYAFFYRRGE